MKRTRFNLIHVTNYRLLRLHKTTLIFFVALFFVIPLTGQEISFMAGMLRFQGNHVVITPELLIFDDVEPVGIFHLNPKDLGDISSSDVNGNWLTGVTWYTVNGTVLPKEMIYLRAQCENWSEGWTQKTKAQLISGKYTYFIYLLLADGSRKLLLNPPVGEDVCARNLLYALRLPQLFGDPTSGLSRAIVKTQKIRFHEVAKWSDLNYGFQIHPVKEEDLRTLKISEKYFQEEHLYATKTDLDYWLDVFTSGEYYLVGNKVFLADLEIEFKGIEECEEWISKMIKNDLTAGLLDNSGE